MAAVSSAPKFVLDDIVMYYYNRIVNDGSIRTQYLEDDRTEEQGEPEFCEMEWWEGYVQDFDHDDDEKEEDFNEEDLALINDFDGDTFQKKLTAYLISTIGGFTLQDVEDEEEMMWSCDCPLGKRCWEKHE